MSTEHKGEKRLKGRRAVVTGGATGIGRATSQRLAADGASVAVNYIGDSQPAKELVDDIDSSQSKAVAIEADVSREDQVTALFQTARDSLDGPIDLLVNNAGVEKPLRLLDMSLEEWNRVLSVNLTGAFLCAREFARALVDQNHGGSIVNVSSVHEVIPWPEYSHYCASKSGLKLFSQTIAKELAPQSIRVVNVAPGAILTPINQDLIDNPDKRREVEDEIPWQRLGTPEEIAAAIAWIASAEAEYITGSTLFVDGGMTLYPRFV
jgi:glucose 1-dehydrogenase